MPALNTIIGSHGTSVVLLGSGLVLGKMTLLTGGNALSHRQIQQMNTQHDRGLFVIWCSLSNGFTADDPGQRRTGSLTVGFPSVSETRDHKTNLNLEDL